MSVALVGVDVRLGVQADVEQVLDEQPEVIVVATGSSSFVPRVSGLEGIRAITAAEVLTARRSRVMSSSSGAWTTI